MSLLLAAADLQASPARQPETNIPAKSDSYRGSKDRDDKPSPCAESGLRRSALCSRHDWYSWTYRASFSRAIIPSTIASPCIGSHHKEHAILVSGDEWRSNFFCITRKNRSLDAIFRSASRRLVDSHPLRSHAKRSSSASRRAIERMIPWRDSRAPSARDIILIETKRVTVGWIVARGGE